MIILSAEYQPEYFPEQDKKNLSLQPPSQQPDLTQTVVGVSVAPCYEYPYSDPPNGKNGLSRSCSEHHYDVPHLSSPPGDPPTSPSTCSHSMDSSSCPVTATPPVETSSEKPLNSDSSHSISSFCSSSKWKRTAMCWKYRRLKATIFEREKWMFRVQFVFLETKLTLRNVSERNLT